jgi:hypothetical protein
MDTEETSPNVSKAFIFSSPEGHTLCQLILAALLPYEPHDFQIEGVCKMLDGVDLFAILATGMGKTGFLSMYMLVVLAIQKEPSLHRQHPCVLEVFEQRY